MKGIAIVTDENNIWNETYSFEDLNQQCYI